MKKLLVSLLVLVVALSCVFAVTVSAEDIIDGNYYTAVCGEGSNWTWDAEALTLTYNNAENDSWTFTFTLKGTDLTWTAYTDNNAETIDDIIVPSYVQVDAETTYAVKVIGGANGQKTIKSVVIYDGPTTINGSVFENCTALEEITIPETVTSIGSYCFKNDAALHTLNLNAKVTKLGRDTFYKCSALTSVTLPDTIQTLEQGVFSSCTSLASVNFPPSLKSIGNTCFTGTALTEVTVPSTVTTLGTYAFSKCASLTKATIECEGMTTLPEGIFQNCALTSVEWPDTVTTIGKYALSNYAGTEIDLTGITTLADYALQYTKLKKVTLPAELVNLGQGAFYRNYDLEELYILSEGLTVIPKNCFNEAKKLKVVEWPDTVTELGESAFYKAGAFPLDLTGITKVGPNCFQWSVHTYYVIPESLVDIGKLAFQNNSLKYMIFEGKTAPTFGGTAGDPRNNGQGLRNDAKISGSKVYVPANGAGYEEAFANFFTTDKMVLAYTGVKVTSVEANGTGYTVGYSYNDLANVYDSSNVDYQNNKVMIALYDGEGALVAAKTVPATETSADIETDATVAFAKIFAVDSIATLVPACEANEFTVK